MKLKTKNFKAEVDESAGIIKGYASTWDLEPDAYGDVVKKGAFAESLKKWEESGYPIPLLFGHNANDPYYNIGAVTTIKEDDTGLYMEAAFDDSEMAQRVRDLAKEGRLKSFSFAYDVLEDGQIELEDGRKARELRKLDIFEISVVTFPANENAVVTDAKSIGQVFVDVIPRFKAGRVLSKSNEDDLKQALTLIQGVLNQLDGDEDTGDEGGADDGKSEGKDANDETEKARNEALQAIDKITKGE